METKRKNTGKSSVAMVKESHIRKHDKNSRTKTAKTNSRGQEGRRHGGRVGDSHQGTSNEYVFTCRKCDERYALRKCRAFGKRCTKCHNPNHYSSCCKAKLSNNRNKKVNNVNEYHETENTDNKSNDFDFKVDSLKIASILTNGEKSKEKDRYESLRLNNKKV